ncbi:MULTISPECIES: class I adenylate-forming enzyme family protein [Mycolicibacterium]|uniref:Long-chain fatty acid--CoA ligase n=2 Tax=Mycolicibacterium TaxID=1866885 RepID=A0A4Z0HXR2_MYCPR|nr:MULTISPECIES: class I adenylate-forming enzyme family protein [Mycolicibacterium]MCV7388704.1 acyl--CoA ligase [Mycolicibacterium porcinum]ORB34814.1 acyl--CoA ligase [Mycolicibacterium porcinum]TGB45495.1 long-chain fatty acid--CoA ligase [Mycolicibacterium peregrinum]TGB47775.1 long-chain fatty acid--CoA ligase [Mycolicibacterium peregrinum]
MTAAASIDSRRQSLRDRFPTWQSVSLAEWLDRCSSEYASRPFVLTDHTAWSYGNVAARSRDLARGLHALGVRSGDRVGMMMANYPEFVSVKFAIARLGAIAVPFNYLYRERELAYVLADSGCCVLITMTRFSDQDYQQTLDSVAPGWDRAGFTGRAPESDEVPELRHVVLLDTGGVPRTGALQLQQMAEIDAIDDAASEWPVVDPAAAGDLLYTSGTTGSPKGVLLSHDAVLRTAYASALTRAYEQGRRILFSLPCYHMFGYIEGLLSAMCVGGAVILQPKFTPENYFREIERHRATDILCVPTMAVSMVESPVRGDYDLSSLNAVLCGSAPAPAWLWRQFKAEFGVQEIVTGYGMTESGGAMTLTLPEDPVEALTDTVGRPKLAGVAGASGTDGLTIYRAVDAACDAVLPAGVDGELVSSGPTAMLRYWNRPTDTAEVLRDGWIHSGDLGRVRADGYLQLTGRTKELYKSGGELVMPKEIEDVLSEHPDISQVYVVGLHNDRWGEIGCAVVVPRPQSTITEHEVLSFCRSALARFKVPKSVVFRQAEELPTTATGKVQKYRLVQQLSQRPTFATEERQ